MFVIQSDCKGHDFSGICASMSIRSKNVKFMFAAEFTQNNNNVLLVDTLELQQSKS